MGSSLFLATIGNRNGTSAAVMWATLYFGYHEAHCLIPRYSRNFMYFKRFIDDIFGIWLLDDTTAWLAFKRDLNHFGILTWEINEPSLSVDFLDLTISIKNGRVETKNFQKELNLYLCKPPASAHPQITASRALSMALFAGTTPTIPIKKTTSTSLPCFINVY